MADIQLKDTPMHTYGDLPKVGQPAPQFIATKPDLTTVSLNDFAGKTVLINVYPSIDTQVCFKSVQKFNETAQQQKEIVILCISMDLPFALKRIAEGESFHNIILLSDYRNREFGELYGLTIADGPLAGLLARAVIVLDEKHHILYHELVKDISNPPNYERALAALITNDK
jgi:thiol peroxidase